MRAAGGEVWVADETALREFPPLRSGWSRVGQPTHVVISGRNARRTLFGALNVTTGELVCLPLLRCRTDDVVMAIAALGAVRPDVRKLLIWDNAPPHHPHRVRDAATAAGITLAFLPFRAPELMPLEEVWRGLKQTVAANRCYASLEELVTRAVAWLHAMTTAERRHRCGLQFSKFEWLPVWILKASEAQRSLIPGECQAGLASVAPFALGGPHRTHQIRQHLLGRLRGHGA